MRLPQHALMFVLVTLLWTSPVAASIVAFDYEARRQAGPLAPPADRRDAEGTLRGSFGWFTNVPDSVPDVFGEPCPGGGFQCFGFGLYEGAAFWSGTIEGGPQDGASFIRTGLDLRVFLDQGLAAISGFSIGAGRVSFTNFTGIENEAGQPVAGPAFATDDIPTFSEAQTVIAFALRTFSVGPDIAPGTDRESYLATDVTPVPLPGAAFMLLPVLAGLGAVAGLRRR